MKQDIHRIYWNVIRTWKVRTFMHKPSTHTVKWELHLFDWRGKTTSVTIFPTYSLLLDCLTLLQEVGERGGIKVKSIS